MLDIAWAKEWTRQMARLVSENREWLLELDRAIGDGDHGENLDRGFRDVLKTESDDVATYLRDLAMVLISKVGGAAGPLYGTAFLKMADEAEGEIDGDRLAAMFHAGAEGIMERGRAVQGEKTMVDVWAPAARAAKDAGPDVVDVLRAAAAAAVAGSDATIDLVATKGRAAYLGPRSAGHRDPGAASSELIFRAALAAAASD